MDKAAIFHRIDSEYCYAIDEKNLVLRIRCKKDDLKQCTVFYGNRCYPAAIVPVEEAIMKKVAIGLEHDYYEVTIHPNFRRVFYYFKLQGKKESFWYYQGEFHKELETNRTYYYQVPYLRREEFYKVPEWASKAVMYQIFPDSFATKNACHDGVASSKQFEKTTCTSVYGGTIKGISENVSYLTKLGINCIYLNPIFPAGAYHKYDTIDYKAIDPCFGTKEDFRELVKKLHENGIRILLDGVFNHSGTNFFAYQDILEKQEKSKYRNWYYDMPLPLLPDYKSDYAMFAYEKYMPKLNTGNPEVANYFAEVGKYWIEEFGIDGWRLDVANEIDKNFWRIFHSAIRSVKKDAIMIAEVWEDAQNWQVYDQFDSAMNYRFMYMCKAFFVEKSIGANEFGQRFQESLMRYPKPVSYSQMNLLDSHDVSRFLSVCNDNLSLYKNVVAVQMTLPGMPSIFAGDERAMRGVKEDEYRQRFVWESEKEGSTVGSADEMTKFYTELIKLRKEHDAFTNGDIEFINCKNDKILAYRRFTDKESFTVYINNSNKDVKVGSKKQIVPANNFFIE